MALLFLQHLVSGESLWGTATRAERSYRQSLLDWLVVNIQSFSFSLDSIRTRTRGVAFYSVIVVTSCGDSVEWFFISSCQYHHQHRYCRCRRLTCVSHPLRNNQDEEGDKKTDRRSHRTIFFLFLYFFLLVARETRVRCTLIIRGRRRKSNKVKKKKKRGATF